MALGTITGNVKVGTDDGAPASTTTIRIYERDTGILVADIVTDVNGNFTATNLDSLKIYTLTAINNSFPGYNAGIKDNAKPISDNSIITLSSAMYPLIIDQDNINLGGSFISGLVLSWPLDDIYLRSSLIVANLNATINYVSYNYWPVEDIYLNSSFISGTLTVVVNYVSYNYWPVEDIYLNSSFISGTLTVVVNYVSYNYWPVEDVYLGASLLGVTLA